MKKIFIIIPFLLLLTLFPGCKEDRPGNSWEDAIITGYDFRRCQCCAGLMITLSDNPEKYGDEFYHWDQEGYEFLELTEFPIYVKVKFESLDDDCQDRDLGWVEVVDLELE